MPSLTPRLLTLCLLAILTSQSSTEVVCPRLPSGVELSCALACCLSYEGNNHGYYCCDPNSANVVKSTYRERQGQQPARTERFSAVYTPAATFQVDYSLLIIGLILSILLSILLSLLCCLLCNGCWLHRRRNPGMYENVGERGDDGFYHICCGFGIPTGTVVFSTHPPQFANEVYGGGSSVSSARNNRAVRFHEDGTPIKGVLKNGNGVNESYNQ